jgi:endonuclease/exonuclease/phosphatase family metal-dependent hydrolase
MKIVSWNIGNFIWAKHLPGRSHFAFHKDDIDHVCKLIKRESADVVFLQEVKSSDIEFIKDYFEEFSYSFVIETKEQSSASLFMSIYPIQDIEHSKSHDYIINGITFFPIHLYAFSPKVRSKQIHKLLSDLPKERGVILGDTNFWIFQRRFLSFLDRKSYSKIISDHDDILKNLGPTCRIFLSLDKIFVTKDLTSHNEKIVKHRINHIDHYMISSEIEVTT